LIDACVVEFDDKIYLQIKENGRYGFVSKDRQLLDTQYESIERVGNTNYLQIKRNGKYGFYDLKNERYHCCPLKNRYRSLK
jgi:hypothetical protein